MLHKSKYKQQYLSQNNSALNFRNASNETTSPAVHEILKNRVAVDSKFLGLYDFSVGTFRRIKKCNISGLVGLQEHVAECTKQPQYCYPSPADMASPRRKQQLILLIIHKMT